MGQHLYGSWCGDHGQIKVSFTSHVSDHLGNGLLFLHFHIRPQMASQRDKWDIEIFFLLVRWHWTPSQH